MSQVVHHKAVAGSTSRAANIILWVLQIALALMFLMAGVPKLLGNPQMVETFDKIGLGQWFRYLTGGLEILSAVLLLIPRTSGLGALLLVGVMVGAVLTHLFIVGGSPMFPLILLVAAAVVAWGRRGQTFSLLGLDKV
jgi:uncharacterized membrane protein YphA (DoxX/SURF4 family)